MSYENKRFWQGMAAIWSVPLVAFCLVMLFNRDEVHGCLEAMK